MLRYQVIVSSSKQNNEDTKMLCDIKDLESYIDGIYNGFGYDEYEKWIEDGSTENDFVREIMIDVDTEELGESEVEDYVRGLFKEHQQEALIKLYEALNQAKKAIKGSDENNTALYLLLNDMNKKIEEMEWKVEGLIRG